jgi:HK97 family phage major capsid protein/HK97 family phage prohead protease
MTPKPQTKGAPLRRPTAASSRFPKTGERLQRFLPSPSALTVDLDSRTVALSFSSEAAVPRWFGDEVLSHAPGAADLSRLNSGAPLLFNHDLGDVLGVVESAQIGSDGKGRAIVRLGRDQRGDWALQQINDGILCNTSFAYVVDNYTPSEDGDTYTATRWTALEISIVTVPADAGVGIGRSFTSKERHTMNFDHTPDAGDSLPHESRRSRQHARESAETERERVLSIQAVCRKWDMDPTSMIENGTTIEEARAAVLERMNRNPPQPIGRLPVTDASGNIGLNDRDAQSFSLVRAINAFMTNDWRKAGFERECSRAVEAQTRRQTQGFFVPLEVMQRGEWGKRAAYNVGAATQGGNLVQTQLFADAYVQALRNSSRVLEAGATVLAGLVGNVDIPRQTSTTNTYWVGESSAPTEAEATFDKVSLRPKTVAALSKMSRLMLLQATPAIEMLVRQDLTAQMGRAIDLAALSGSGSSNQPTGIMATAGVGSVVMGTNGAAITLDALVALETALGNSNAPVENRSYLMNTKTIGSLKNLKATTGTYLWTTSTPGQRSGTPPQFNGYDVYSTNQLRSTLTKGASGAVCSELVFGAWSELIVAQWGALEVVMNPYDATGFTTGDVLIRAMQTMDIAARHPASFAIISDALTP